MGVSVETSAQLDGFRHDRKMTTVGACPTWWMSATLDQSRLATVDHLQPGGGWPVERLSPEEKVSGRSHRLYTAAKAPVPAPFKLAAAAVDGYAHQVTELAVQNHKQGTLTLVVVNRVKRAQKIYEALTKAEKKGRQITPPLYDPSRVALVHSRFRRADRQRHEALLFGEGDRIVVATQAVEAGVDVSARLLIAELAPWSSLVQRIGRCNRRAEFTDAKVVWVDIEADAKGELLLPYSADALEKARAAMSGLEDASLCAFAGVTVAEAPVVRPVIRRRDLVDLFDTTPDLCGQDLDISRYIRDEQDNDVQFFWRQLGDAARTPDEQPPQRDELCRVSISEAAKFLKNDKVRGWQWNPLSEEWEPVQHARPGATYLLAVASGGYSDATGWTGDCKDRPTPCLPPASANESYAGNPLSLREIGKRSRSIPPRLSGNWAKSPRLFHSTEPRWRHSPPPHSGTMSARRMKSSKPCSPAEIRHAKASYGRSQQTGLADVGALASAMNSLPPLPGCSKAPRILPSATSSPTSLPRITVRFASPFARCQTNRAIRTTPRVCSPVGSGMATGCPPFLWAKSRCPKSRSTCVSCSWARANSAPPGSPGPSPCATASAPSASPSSKPSSVPPTPALRL
jgi:hypothetical protein